MGGEGAFRCTSTHSMPISILHRLDETLYGYLYWLGAGGLDHTLVDHKLIICPMTSSTPTTSGGMWSAALIVPPGISLNVCTALVGCQLS